MLTVVCWKWKARPDWVSKSRVEYSAKHVNVLYSMFKRHYHKPFRFVCITDDPTGINCETYPLWNDLADAKNPIAHWVTCYPRLKIFSKEMGEVFGGDRILSLDLDIVIADDITELLEREGDFVGWDAGNKNSQYRYCGSMYMFDAGSQSFLYDDFDPETSPQESHDAGFLGSDQAWMCYKLGPDKPVWTKFNGVLSYRNDGLSVRSRRKPLPNGTKMVHFHGRHKPWNERPVTHLWVAEHWR